jgi:diguanylate cyclase (GGDEF)-like protein
VVAQRLQHHLRAADVVARTGGDEFVAVLAGDDLAPALSDIARRLRTAIAEPIRAGGGLFRVGASIGYAVGAAGDDLTGLVATADAAMYREKRRPEQAA